MVWVEGKVPGSKTPSFAPFGFEHEFDSNDGEVFRVHHLISKLVFESVREFNLREKEDSLRILTHDKIADGLTKGKIGRARAEHQSVDLDDATGEALQAFEDGLYVLFVDDDEKRTLDDPVYLQPDTKITIIRLTALSGR